MSVCWSVNPVRDADGKIVVRLNTYARKDSGSFFTPQELVDLIVDRTLKPAGGGAALSVRGEGGRASE